ncbi:hypothetical protein, partial [Mesorhizobium sp. M1E.F.Ca.ET.063.01.1.1]|uniref:hypothetical protein n=1 Tax=Mesorhizobium sp. M1E.F.Ca.ET.063.01.1.1 TaxID=2496750 RepID=UPI001AECDF5C
MESIGGPETHLDAPGRAAVMRALAQPTERIFCDARKAPAHRCTGAIGADLHDRVAFGASELTAVILVARIAPENVPGVDAKVVDAQRRAIEGPRPKRRRRTGIPRGQDPDVLNRFAFQDPAEMHLAAPGKLGAVLQNARGVEGPGADEAAVE